VAFSRWTGEEADTYLRHVDAQRAVRATEGWALDLSWLADQGLALPPALAAFAR